MDSLKTEREIRELVRGKIISKQSKIKPHKHIVEIFSEELKDKTGNGKMQITVYSNKSDRSDVKKKMRSKQDILNEVYRREHIAKDPCIDEKVTTYSAKIVEVGLTVSRTKFKLIFNKGTDTTTTAIIGSSFAAGKTTIMMNSILPEFYGKRVTSNDLKRGKPILESRVASPASISSGERPYKMIKYVNILFSLNSHIKAYKGYTDLVRITGFEDSQQQVIKDAHKINVKTENKYRFALFIDDILETRHSKMISNCYMTYRNAEISTCICTQYLFRLNKDVRGNIQNLLFCKLLSEEAIKGVIDTYLGSYFNQMKVPKSLWVEFYRYATDNFNFIHLHQGTGQIRFCKPVPFDK